MSLWSRWSSESLIALKAVVRRQIAIGGSSLFPRRNRGVAEHLMNEEFFLRHRGAERGWPQSCVCHAKGLAPLSSSVHSSRRDSTRRDREAHGPRQHCYRQFMRPCQLQLLREITNLEKLALWQISHMDGHAQLTSWSLYFIGTEDAYALWNPGTIYRSPSKIKMH